MPAKVYNYTNLAKFVTLMFSASLFSFSVPPGGEHFEIYLNKKLVLQQLVSHTTVVKSLLLDQRNADDQVDVFYSHCGQVGSNRTLVIEDGKTVLKQWRFSDVGSKKFMSLGAKELLALKSKAAGGKLNLIYVSEQLPEGRLLATIALTTENDKAISK